MSDLIPAPAPPGGGEFLFYQSDDGRIRLQVRLEDESVWLTQAQLSELFQRERSVITKHIRNVFGESELEEASVCANFARTAADGKTYRTAYYNLDVIISVGYRQSEGQVIYFRAKHPTGLTICGTTDNIDGEGIFYGRRRKR